MKPAPWAPAEDAVIRAEVALGDRPGSRWADRAVSRLPGRTRPATQVRASMLRLTSRMRDDPLPPPAPIRHGSNVPDFLARMPEFNRR